MDLNLWAKDHCGDQSMQTAIGLHHQTKRVRHAKLMQQTT